MTRTNTMTLPSENTTETNGNAVNMNTAYYANANSVIAFAHANINRFPASRVFPSTSHLYHENSSNHNLPSMPSSNNYVMDPNRHSLQPYDTHHDTEQSIHMLTKDNFFADSRSSCCVDRPYLSRHFTTMYNEHRQRNVDRYNNDQFVSYLGIQFDQSRAPSVNDNPGPQIDETNHRPVYYSMIQGQHGNSYPGHQYTSASGHLSVNLSSQPSLPPWVFQDSERPAKKQNFNIQCTREPFKMEFFHSEATRST